MSCGVMRLFAVLAVAAALSACSEAETETSAETQVIEPPVEAGSDAGAQVADAPEAVEVDPAQAAPAESESVAEVRATIECGEASYYADSLAGNATASGEPYDPARLTAAHKTLPLGAEVVVTRELGSGAVAVVVKVNDRGPYADGRVIDLSRAAAEKLDLIQAGKGDVCISEVK